MCMKKQYHFIKSEQAFFLPLVLVSSLIIILIITTFITMYHSEIMMTENLIHNLKVDTVIQMSLEQFKMDFYDLNESKGNLYYTFPNGKKVNLQYTFVANNDVMLYYQINLDEEYYDVSQFYNLDNIFSPHE